MKQDVEKQLGETVIDFANASTSSEACRKHFANIEVDPIVKTTKWEK